MPYVPAGFEDYGVVINSDKTRANFDSPHMTGKQQTLREAGSCQEFIAWCGLLVNCSTLELQADYTRYEGQHLATAICINATMVRLLQCTCMLATS